MCALVLLCGALAACSASFAPRLVENGGAMTMREAEGLAESADLSRVSGIDVAHAPDARVDALVWLRRQGAVGDRAATLLTVGFPDRTAAVPLIVEVATVDGVRSLVVVEAFGGSSGPLTYRRLWVFDLATGDVRGSAAFR